MVAPVMLSSGKLQGLEHVTTWQVNATKSICNLLGELQDQSTVECITTPLPVELPVTSQIAGSIREKLYRQHINKVEDVMCGIYPRAIWEDGTDVCLRTKMWLCSAVTPDNCALSYTLNEKFGVEVRMDFDRNNSTDDQIKSQLLMKNVVTGNIHARA